MYDSDVYNDIIKKNIISEWDDIDDDDYEREDIEKNMILFMNKESEKLVKESDPESDST